MASPVNAGDLSYEQNTLHAADFNASRDNSVSLSSGTIGEIAEFEVGEDSTAAQYRAIFVGQPASNNTGDRKGNELYAQLYDGSPGSEISDTAQFAFAARNKGELGGGKQGALTGFITHRGEDATDPAQRTPVNVNEPAVPDGRLLSLLAKDETASLTVNINSADTTLELPIMGGK